MTTISRGVMASVLALPFAFPRTPSVLTTTTLRGHPVQARDLAKLSLGHSTRQDVERVLGAADAYGADGSLVYRATAVRRIGHGNGTVEHVVGTRSTIFCFIGDTLARVCGERS